MDILGVGPLELLVMLVFILIFVGPERLPHVARQIGKVYRQLHEMSRMVAAQWQEELSAAAELEGEKKDLRQALTEPLQAAKADAERILTASLTPAAAAQPGNAKPPGGSTAVSLPTAVTAPDGRAADVLPISATPLGAEQALETREAPAAEEITSPPEMAASTPAATEASPVAPPADVNDPVPPVASPADGDPEHGNQ
ncbi:MAG: twin-arginine translocase TatA/TatE family subunit [Anaerolineae bacterium]|nr:twin-arginine translocase TatA/TatE family subunit [Anaerolineae bacterium]MDW8070150.1 twin-arginine translocase TatA/TatE family subunit [Anaerolineae bacterium]